MSVVRIKKRMDKYVVLDRGCLNSVGLSWKAKGLWAYLMALPDDWVVNLKDLANRSTDGRASVQAGMAELIKHGYVSREQARTNAGKIEGWDYTIYEVPPEGWSTDGRFSADGFSADGKSTPTKDCNIPSTDNTKHVIKSMAMAWQERMGGTAPYSRIGGVLRKLRGLGHSSEDIERGWLTYMKQGDTLYMSPEAFASKAGHWIGQKRRSFTEIDLSSALGM